jgi:hypothetical protein
MMKEPPRWGSEELKAEVEKARALFKLRRLKEPLERWKAAFDQHAEKFRRLFDEFEADDPASLTAEKLARLFSEKLDDALRYLAGPPISADDLKVLAEASLSPGRIARDPEAARRVLDTILLALDPRRFPWIAERREATEPEKAAAILASAALLTVQRVSTDRRTGEKEAQESAVKAFLLGMGFEARPARTINTLADAPGPGEFCGESLVGSRKADVPVRLHDGRLMPIECKVSNSSTNSVKRINNDAEVKAGIWHREFGIRQVVPAAVLSGVFKVHNLIQAQTGGLTLFWAHKLEDLRAFVEATRN